MAAFSDGLQLLYYNRMTIFYACLRVFYAERRPKSINARQYNVFGF